MQDYIYYVGNYVSAKDAEKPLVIDADDVKIGILNYTEHINGIPIPEEKKFAVSLLDFDAIRRDISKLDNLDVDIIVVYLHFGSEYQRLPSDAQKEIIDKLA